MAAGAGAAGAAGFGPLHVGTDGGGSIRIPAAWCGLVGLKPTYGRVPQWPAGAFASVSCLGPMTRTVRDAALLLSALARYDVSVGVLRNPGFDAPVDAGGVAAVERAAALLAEAGASVDEADPGLPDTRGIFARVWGAALARLVQSFPAEQHALLDSGLLEAAASGEGLSAIQFMDAETLRVAAAHAMALLHQRFDLVLCPTVPGPPPLADRPTCRPVEALWTEWAPWTFTFNLTRQPAISVPLGLGADGLPRSVQIAAAQYRDDLVLRAARVTEIAAPSGTPPEASSGQGTRNL